MIQPERTRPMSIWDDPELREGGEFAKLENKGD